MTVAELTAKGKKAVLKERSATYGPSPRKHGTPVIRAAASDVPVIFMTAHDDAETRKQARQPGCAAYLHKPFSAGLLIDAIRQALPAAEERP